MTNEQSKSVATLREQFGVIGWRVTIREVGSVVVVTGYGGPRAMRVLHIAPDGCVTTAAMA